MFVILPIPSISTSQVSPALRKRGGLWKKPTPGGVPVRMTSPGSNLKNLYGVPSRAESIQRGCHCVRRGAVRSKARIRRYT